MSQEYKPRLVITMGDAAGSGPEIITKTLADREVRKICRPVVVGDAATMKAALEITGVPGKVKAIKKLSEASFKDGVIEVIDLFTGKIRALSAVITTFFNGAMTNSTVTTMKSYYF